jgi:hypothetical protein
MTTHVGNSQLLLQLAIKPLATSNLQLEASNLNRIPETCSVLAGPPAATIMPMLPAD